MYESSVPPGPDSPYERLKRLFAFTFSDAVHDDEPLDELARQHRLPPFLALLDAYLAAGYDPELTWHLVVQHASEADVTDPEQANDWLRELRDRVHRRLTP